jgi:hypothetical protein
MSFSVAFLLFLAISSATSTVLSNVSLAEIDERSSDNCPIPDGHYVIDAQQISGSVMFKARRGNCYAEIGVFSIDGNGPCCVSLSGSSTPTTNGVQVFSNPGVYSMAVIGTDAMGTFPVVFEFLDMDPPAPCLNGFLFGGTLTKTENREGINSFQGILLSGGCSV